MAEKSQSKRSGANSKSPGRTATAGTGGGSKKDDSMSRSGGGGSHRSFVARRFLVEEEADDLDMEPEAMDLIEEDSEAGHQRAGVAGGNIFDRRDNRQVDQSVNLMDTSAATYESKHKKKHARPRGLKRGSKHGTSMVDVFLDYATTEGPGQRGGKVGDLSKSRKSKCKDLIFSTRFLVVVVGIILVVLAVAFGGKLGSNNDKPKDANAKESGASRMSLIQNKIVASGASSEEDLKDTKSHAFKALKWLSEWDEAVLKVEDPGLIQRYVVAALYYATQPGDSESPLFPNWKQTDKWMTKVDVCEWWGMDCENILSRNVIVHCNLTSNQLQGAIPSTSLYC